MRNRRDDNGSEKIFEGCQDAAGGKFVTGCHTLRMADLLRFAPLAKPARIPFRGHSWIE